MSDDTYSYTITSKDGKTVESGCIFDADPLPGIVKNALKHHKNTISKIEIRGYEDHPTETGITPDPQYDYDKKLIISLLEKLEPQTFLSEQNQYVIRQMDLMNSVLDLLREQKNARRQL